MSSVKAVGHLVLVKVDEPEEKSEGGIVLVHQTRDAEKRGAEIGVVLDIGPTAYMNDGLGNKRWVDVGDRIYFAKYSGKWVSENPDDPKSDKLLMIRDDDVCGKVVQ